jgi:hypothetical protein
MRTSVKRRVRWIGCAAAASALAVQFPSPVSAAEFEIKITFDQTFDRIEPNPKLATTHYEMAATFSSSGEVSHSERQFFEGGKISSIDTTMHLGGGTRTGSGGSSIETRSSTIGNIRLSCGRSW